MSDVVTMGGNAAEELKRRADRRMELLDTIADAQTKLKEHKQQDKDDGYSEKAIGQVIKELRRGADYQVDQLTLELEVETYRRAVGLPTTVEDAQKAARSSAAEIDEPKSAKRGRGKKGANDE